MLGFPSEIKKAHQGGFVKTGLRLAALLVIAVAAFSQESKESAPVSIVGYLRDSGCVHRFHEVLKPLPNGCLEACVRAGSPLVVLTRDEKVYHPISSEMPDVDVGKKLLPFAGKLVRITGHIYSRGGSSAISLEKIEEVKE
jgi:hypothetical protein